jgi:hypothetical protein
MESFMRTIIDGPASPHFTPLPLLGNIPFEQFASSGSFSEKMAAAAEHAPRGRAVCWGIPFEITQPVVLFNQAQEVPLPATSARWLVFLHTSDSSELQKNPSGFISAPSGIGRLNELAAYYFIRYADGSEARVEIRRRHQVGDYRIKWGENCFQAVEHHKPFPVHASHEQTNPDWGHSQTRVAGWEYGPWINWLYAWENPYPEKTLIGLRLEPVSGTVVLSAVSAGYVNEQPLRWRTRRKAVLYLPQGIEFQPNLDNEGRLSQLQLDMGQIISTQPRPVYPNTTWDISYNNQLPLISTSEFLVEYTAHPQACFTLVDGRTIAVEEVENTAEATNGSINSPTLQPASSLQTIAPSCQRIKLRVVDAATGKPVAVKLHLHGEWGEYLAPVDHHRILNPVWFEDYSVDFYHRGQHACTYIPGEALVDLPLGAVYVEISKGFEVRPLRKVIQVTSDTQELTISVDKVLPWRERGWVTADTHVHFLSPISALLEGAGEGVNIINLLASQWGELMTNIGDFDGRNTWGSRETGGDGEWMVRVGTENRQHILGHISLLGYQGRIIAPMTSAGPDEAALGDPVDVLLTEWARQCKSQGGLVVLPHFPFPRAEHAASVIAGEIDAVEMTSWGDLYSGIDPYSLSDWYRYLNCGYITAAVGGTDKMASSTAVGTVRTYAHIAPDQPFTFEAWMEAVRRAETFVSYGPLLDFTVEGRPMGSRINLPAGGGTLDITWQVASVTIPVSRVELVINGEIRHSQMVDPAQSAGSWSIKVDKSSWLALLVRGGYADRPEIIAAHSSPVMVEVAGTQLLAAADAITILEQVEGALAFLDTVGTRAEDLAYKRMRLVLQGAHRGLHNRLHQMGVYHDHPAGFDEPHR